VLKNSAGKANIRLCLHELTKAKTRPQTKVSYMRNKTTSFKPVLAELVGRFFLTIAAFLSGTLY
jgi:hypothetical protein